jgi:hypothetical protein
MSIGKTLLISKFQYSHGVTMKDYYKLLLDPTLVQQFPNKGKGKVVPVLS